MATIWERLGLQKRARIGKFDSATIAQELGVWAMTRSGANVSEQSSLAISTVYACVYKIASTISGKLFASCTVSRGPLIGVVSALVGSAEIYCGKYSIPFSTIPPVLGYARSARVYRIQGSRSRGVREVEGHFPLDSYFLWFYPVVLRKRKGRLAPPIVTFRRTV